MNFRSLLGAALCFMLGASPVFTFPAITRHHQSFYAKHERTFASPLPSGDWLIRSDRFGKGHFGASRGSRGQRKHQGIDLTAEVGTPVLASKTGRILTAAFDKGYGQYLEVLHPDGLVTCYAHLLDLEVREGEWVRQGRVIGHVGKSGNASNPRMIPHLHYEIRQAKTPLDPASSLLKHPAITVK